MKKKLNIWKLAAMCLLAVILVMPAFMPAAKAENAKIYRLVRDRVRLRSSPTSSYDNIITVLSKGTRMVKLKNDGNWFKVVTANGKTGWIFSKPYLSYYGAASKSRMGKIIYTTNQYSKAKTSSSKIQKLSANTPVIVKAQKGSWYKVQTLGGKQGWVKTKYVKHLY